MEDQNAQGFVLASLPRLPGRWRQIVLIYILKNDAHLDTADAPRSTSLAWNVEMSADAPVEAQAVVEAPKEEVAPAVPESAPPAEEAPKEEAAAEAPAAAVEEEKKEEQKEEEKQPEPPKDPKEDPVGWVGSLIAPAVHKVNHEVLTWAQQLAVDEEEKRKPLPGKNGAVTKNQFLGFLRDGTLLAQLANKLQPGAVETVHEGEAAQQKENQQANLEGFLNFVKEKAALSDEQVFSATDLLEKGKAAYPAVFGTLARLGLVSQEKFEQKGLDMDAISEMASQVVKTSIIQTILNFFRRARARTTQAAKSEKAAASEGEKASDAEKKPLEEVAEEECKKVESQPAAAAEPAAAAPVAVA
uniref:Calponin-homology (CH) domain-containing protein n=2 Tax=Steinernema glaseri TaxID=37863 RepID=A0A1I7ZTX1_9BILA